MLLSALMSILVAADTSNPPAIDVTNVWTTLLTWGPGGIVIILILLGQLVPKKQLSQAEKTAENWRKAYETERDAHQITRSALAKSEERGDLAVENSQLTTKLLEGIGQATGHIRGTPTRHRQERSDNEASS